MKDFLDITNIVNYFRKGSFFTLLVVSIVLFFNHYNLNVYFYFEFENWIIFILWLYLIFNLFSLYKYYEKSNDLK